MDRLKGKVAIVTGSTSGIGIGIAKLFAAEGAKVVICGRREAKGQAVVDEIVAAGGEASYHFMDITDPSSTEKLIADTAEKYGKIDIVYGSRSMDDLVDYQEIIDEWCKEDGIDVHLTIDREQEGWDGHVGFVPNFVKELGFDTNKTAIICGPPIMIKFTLQGLIELGFDKTQVYTTMELRMKCGIGKCGRCNIGDKYVCKDGPVFRCDELDELPDEY